MRIDLNADVGEETGQDPAILPVITSASIACGFHAGDPRVMRETVVLARQAVVAVGAHPGFRDRDGFGRRDPGAGPREVEHLVAYQVGALAAVAALEGVHLGHVKPHGFLYNAAARDPELAAAVARAVAAADPSLVLFGPPGSCLLTAAADAGLATAAEGFADRAYRPDGSLVPRSERGAVIEDEAAAVEQALSMVLHGEVAATDGSRIHLPIRTLCVHGDTPGAARLAAQIRRALEAEGVEVAAVGRVAR